MGRGNDGYGDGSGGSTTGSSSSSSGGGSSDSSGNYSPSSNWGGYGSKSALDRAMDFARQSNGRGWGSPGSGGGVVNTPRGPSIYDLETGALVGRPSYLGGVMTTSKGWNRVGGQQYGLNSSNNPYNSQYKTAQGLPGYGQRNPLEELQNFFSPVTSWFDQTGQQIDASLNKAASAIGFEDDVDAMRPYARYEPEQFVGRPTGLIDGHLYDTVLRANKEINNERSVPGKARDFISDIDRELSADTYNTALDKGLLDKVIDQYAKGHYQTDEDGGVAPDRVGQALDMTSGLQGFLAAGAMSALGLPPVNVLGVDGMASGVLDFTSNRGVIAEIDKEFGIGTATYENTPTGLGTALAKGNPYIRRPNNSPAPTGMPEQTNPAFASANGGRYRF